MSKAPSPYCVDTEAGPLELTKGTYLTMLRRKSSVTRTLTKTKPIAHFHSKKTIKRPYARPGTRFLLRNQKLDEIHFRDRNDKQYKFSIYSDGQVFANTGVLPSIPMEYDNDAESEWPEIEHTIENMALSLRMAAFDRGFGQ